VSENKRAAQAADWILRLSQPELAEEELAAWVKWSADPQNLQEFQRLRATWRVFDQVRGEAVDLLSDLEERSERSLWQRHPGWSRVAAAASIALALGVAWHLLGSGVFSEKTTPVAVRPAVRSTVLPDGSAVTLAPRTDIATDFDPARRSLALSSGEAYFRVRPDKTRPFVVRTAGVTVTAVGTAFDVRSTTDRVVVTVQEGVVNVAAPRADGDGDTGPWRVGAGSQISYDCQRGTARVSEVDPSRALAWREGRLEYVSEPLSNVVADVSRYSTRPIEIGDPSVGMLTFTGTVLTRSTDDWLSALQTALPLRAIPQGDHIVLVSAESITGR